MRKTRCHIHLLVDFMTTRTSRQTNPRITCFIVSEYEHSGRHLYNDLNTDDDKMFRDATMSKIRENPIIRQILKSGAGTAFRVTSVSLNLIFSIIGARFLGAEQFGQYVSLMAIAGLVTVALSFGLPTLITREVAASRGQTEARYLHELHDWAWVLIILLVSLTLISWAFFTTTLTLVLLFTTISNLSALGAALLAGQEKVLRGAMITDGVRPLASLLALIGFVIFGFLATGRNLGMPDPSLPTATISNLILAQIAGVSSALLAMFLILGSKINLSSAVSSHRAFPPFNNQHLIYAKAGAFLAATQLLINSTTQIDILILRWLSTSNDVAYYFAAARGALIVSFFFGINALFAEPKLTRLMASGQKAETQNLIRQTTLSGIFLTVAASVVALLFGNKYLNLFGEGFEQGFPSLIILIGGLILWSFSGPAQSVLRATRKDGILLKATATSVVLNIVVSVTLVPILGIIGAAIGSAAQFTTYGVLLAIACRRYTGLKTDILAGRQSSVSSDL